jgi:ribose transport system permease protein
MSRSEAETPALSPLRALRGVQLAVVRDYGIVIAFIALFITLSVASDVFFTWTNMVNLGFQAAPIGIMACGGALVFIAGGFDLSVGAIAAFSAVVAGKAYVGAGIPVWPALILGALTGLGFGVGNGLLVTVARVNAFIATLASSIIVYGIAIAVTGGFLISIESEEWSTLGLGKAWGINYPIFVWIGFALFCGFLLWRTTFGRYVYAAGGNAEAARLSGVRVGRVRTATFAISGLSGGIAGVILSSEVATAQADAGNAANTFDAITAIVLGGVSILGGEGAIWRAVLGAFFLQMIGNGFNLLNVRAEYQNVFKGSILVLAVSLDAWARRTRRA